VASIGRKRLFITVSLLLLVAAPAFAQGFLQARGSRIVSSESGREVLLRGMGLGGWMLQEPYMLGLSGAAINQQDIQSKIVAVVGKERADRFYEAWLQHFITKADIDSLAAWGFNSVRLPMHYALYTLPVEKEPVPGRNTWLREGFRLTDSLLRWCAANRMYLILDLHAAPSGQGNDLPIADRDSSRPSLWQSAACQEKTVALWQELARRYARERWIGAYDLLNETNWNFTDPSDKHGCNDSLNGPMRALFERISTAIRSVDKNHLVIIEGNCWGNNYRNVLPPWDSNMALSFHRYWNENTDASLASILSLRERYNIPLWMGESGENSNAWFRDAVRLLEKHDIGWAWWPMKKMGMNNPLELPSNPRYRQLQAYWKGTGPKPSADSAYEGLMQLALDSRAGRNRYHPDVVDALFRQVKENDTRPFRLHRIDIDPVVYAAHFDMGPIGSAYHSNKPGNYWVSTGKHTDWNRGWVYRNDAIDILPSEVPDSYDVSLAAQEWLQYSVVADAPGRYLLELHGKPEEAGRPVAIVNGTLLNAAASAAGWTIPTVELRSGVNRIRIAADGGTIRFSQIRFIPQQAGTMPRKH
jgi:endoglucanase